MVSFDRSPFNESLHNSFALFFVRFLRFKISAIKQHSPSQCTVPSQVQRFFFISALGKVDIVTMLSGSFAIKSLP